ncbi:MAG: TldD/PmbA family protein [Eubacteriales bacterium]
MEELTSKAALCLDLVKEKNIEKAFVSVSSREVNEFNVDGGEFSLFRTLFDNALSLTMYNAGRKGFVSLNRIDAASIKAAVESCADVSESSPPDPAWDIAPKGENGDFVKGCPTPDIPALFDRSKVFMANIAEDYPAIIIEQMIIKHIKSKSAYQNTNGVIYNTVSGKNVVEVMFSAHEGEKSSSFYGSGVSIDSLDKPFIELGTFREDFENIQKQVHTTPLEGKFTGTVVLPPQTLGGVLYVLLSNFCGDMSILNGTSLWKDMIGKKVADEKITLSLSPLDGRVVCGERFTSEGFRSENYDIIKDGALNSFMLSLYVANKTGRTRARNSSFNLIMAPGEKPIAEIIKGIDKGIIVGRLSGGDPGANGEFAGVAKNSFYVENGEIKHAISETMISGNLLELVKNLRGISKEVSCDGDSVLPYAVFDNVTISGK